MNKYFLYIVCFPTIIFSNLNHNGQIWIDYNDSKNYESLVGYIPEFNFKYQDFDFMYSNKIIIRNLDSNYYNQDYRYWGRYHNEFIDIRVGLQKISFGSAFILRNLNWFDSIDFRNSTNQTIGQKSFSIKYFSTNNFDLNFWLIPDDDDELSYGSRLAFSNKFGNYGFVFFKDNTNYNHSIINIPQIVQAGNIFSENLIEFKQNERLGFDYRYDGYFGLWLESSYINFIKNQIIDDMFFRTIGIDYTLNTWNGIYLMFESMYYKFDSIDNSILEDNISSLMIQYPIGILYDLSLVRLFDNQSDNYYDFIRLTTIYDYFTVNYSYSINPEEYGNNFQMMIVYNY